MEIDKWVGPYKIRSFPWIDGKLIYFNVQYYASGQSIERPPVWDKTVYIMDNAAAQRVLNEFLGSLAERLASIKIPDGGKAVLTIE